MQIYVLSVRNLLGVALVLGSCGYRFQRKEFHAQSNLAWSGANTLFVPVVDNMTSLSGIESVMTNALRESMGAVRGLSLRHRAADARFILLTTIEKYERKAAPSTVTGDSASEKRGGLIRGQSTAADISLNVGIKIEMVEVLRPGATTRRILWSRTFDERRSYQAFDRFEENAGSASDVHVNLSREELKYKEIAQVLSSKVVDQMVQNF